MRSRTFTRVLILLSAMLGSVPALAGHISVDFGPVASDGDDFGTNSVGNGTACTAGSSGPESCPLTLTNDGSTAKIPLGFPIDFGTGAVSSLYINENGIVSFTGPISTNSFGNLSGLNQPVIAPFYTDLTSVPFVGTVFEMLGTNFGQLMYQRGSATAVPNSDGSFDLTAEVPAFSVLWYGPTDADATQIFTQLIIYSHASSAAGDFDLRIRYGQRDGDQYNTGTGTTAIAGLLLGTNTLSITGALDGTKDYFYSFRGGKLVGAVTTPPLTLSCPTATAQVGTSYNSALASTGGVTPYTFSESGSFPPGLHLDSGSGMVTGNPTAAGAFSFTGKVTDSSGTSGGTLSASCTITVTPAVTPATLKVSPGSVSFGTVGRFNLLSRTVVLSNTGTSSISLARASVSGPARNDFAALSLCPRTLGAGKSCPVFVIFFAADLGSVTATLNIPNGATDSPQGVPLTAIVTRLKH